MGASAAASHPRVLFSTAYRSGPYYDYWGSNTPRTFFRLGGKRLISMGLRFLQQNVPGIEILEMPTAAEYRRALARGWDVVGISFYLDETPRALEMADLARRAGVGQVWGGNYGVLLPEAASAFDRVFLGYAEDDVARALGLDPGPLLHPPLVVPFGLPFFNLVRFGILFTTRGCGFKCAFCQTPAFAPRPTAIPLESIERVLDCYAAHGVTDLLIPDENFGMIPRHGDAVAECLARRRMLWTAMTRTDLLVQRFDQWRSQGLAGVMIGIESMDQRALDSLEKQTSAERLGHAAELCRRHGIVLVGFYIIGLESDTEESVRAGIRRLAALGCDLVQVCVLTPLPQTPLWRRIEERYGFDERDYSRFDGKHLVWKHPALTKGLVRDLLAWSYGILYPPSNPVQTLRKFTRAHVGRLGLWRTLPHLVGSSLKLNLCPVRQLPMLMRHPAAAGA